MPTRPANQSLNRSVWLRGIGGFVALIFFLGAPCWAQLPQAGDTTSPPTPGVGHDYIHSPVETVNPANGSVSIRIPIRIPEGRELTIPLSIAYDSNGAFYVAEGPTGNPTYKSTSGTPFSQGGWDYTFPLITYGTNEWTHPGSGGGRPYTCDEDVNFVFQDPTGNRHNLGLYATGPGPGNQPCPPSSITTGGEGPILATIPSNTIDPPVTITDGNGTVYSFSGFGTPASITDRNGNRISISGTSSSATVTDTAGRPAVSVPTFGSNPDNITVDGLTSPYQVSWTTASANFTNNMVDLDQGDPNDGGCSSAMSATASVASQVVLPNGQKYTFTYDPTYGTLSKITYPSGGYVRYVWGLNHQAEALYWIYVYFTSIENDIVHACRYDFPAITDRYVSFDGSIEVLHQQFTYSTTWQSGGLTNSLNWTTKQTTVATTDLVRNTSFNTVYTYSPVGTPCVPDPNPYTSKTHCLGYFTQQIPVEQTIQYNGTNGSLLRTVAKTWANFYPPAIASETTTLNDVNPTQVSKVTYNYNSNQEQIEKDEYDYGSGAPPSTPTRKTVTNYASFSGAHIVDLPSSVITCSGTGSDAACNNSGTRVAETDSSYDQSTPQPQSPLPVQHVAAGSARGNLTTVTKQCFNGPCGGGSPATTYTYYDTGQINQMTDPKGNITTFSYTDSYSSCGGNAPPSGATNAYLTQVTFPPTNGVNHIESYCYDYTPGLLRGSTDENGQTSSYTYADSLDRLTQANYPDGGQTTVSYNDTPPTPSVTVQKKLNTSGQLVTSTTITNGMGLATETELTSDPQGTDFTVTSYDGLGRASTVTNPYRSTGDPTYGVTTYAYDALSRTTSVTKPDGGVVSTVYSGNCTTVTDEAGKNRESCTDGLGRMTSVIENPGGLGYVTNYTYDTLNNLLTVVQGGSRNRSFSYDSLKRLLTSQNPESGTVTYTYDANGNVTTKTDARGITTTNSYDALNRVTGVTYSNSDPSVSYTYDQATCIGQSPCFNIGHRTTMTDAGGTENLSYDPMGREWGEQRTTNSVTKTTTYGYDLLGNIKTLTYPSGRTITYTYDSAGRPSDAVDTANSINYTVGSCANGASSPSTGTCYAPMGAVSQMQNGTNLVSTYIYNKRLQPCWFYATTGTALATSTLCTAAGSGTHATGNVTIDGLEQKTCSGSAPVQPTNASPTIAAGCPVGQGYIYDHGHVSITVGSFTAIGGFGQGSTASSVATALTSSLNSSNSPVTATLSGTTITLTSKATGTSANYTLSTSVAWDSVDFSSPSFTGTPSGPTLTGGSGAAPGNILDLSYNFNLGAGDNGNVIGINNDRDTTRSQSFLYDNLNRITTGKTSSTSGSNCWGETYTVDQWGNLTAIGAVSGYTGCTQESLSVSATANNQLSSTGYSYDLSGNMLTDTANTYAYNAESEIKSAAGVNYTYDGDGNRVYKSNGKIYWYGAGTEILDESDGSGNFTNEYVFFGGKRVAMRNVLSGVIYYYAEDMLGSSRTIVQAGQTTTCYDGDFYPFGGERIITNTCSQNYKFEGKERDTESGNDDFGARYYSSRLGRWLSADWSSVPVPVPYANLSNPQTLNLYAMVSDNPETFADLDGHCGPYQNSLTGIVPCPNRAPFIPIDGEGFEAGNSGIAGAGCSMDSCTSAAEVSAQTTQIAAEEAAEQAANQEKEKEKKSDDTPSKFVIEESKTENKGPYSFFYYQLENSKGKPLTGNGYSVEEHMSGDLPSSVKLQSSEDKFVPLTHGEGKDKVGLDKPPGKSVNKDWVVYQTFTIQYKGKPYILTTKFKHDTLIVKGVVTNKVTDVVP